jgi:hypothetical protein
MIPILEPGTVRQEGHADPHPTTKTSFLLSELASEWHYFNHGMLFSHAGFTYPTEDPVADWYAQQPAGTQVIQQPFGSTIIAGLPAAAGIGRLSWGHIVCAVRHEVWPSLFEFMGGVAAVDRNAQRFYRLEYADVQVLDPVAAERDGLLSGQLPTITLTVFCVDGNHGRWGIRYGANSIQPPEVVALPVEPETQRLARAVLHDNMGELAALDTNPAFAANRELYR